MAAESGYLSMTLSISGVVAVARHYSDPDLLRATFPALSDEQAFAIVEGRANLRKEGDGLLYELTPVH